MCDCYDEKCHENGCKEILPVHLGDYETDRNEIIVYCRDHLPLTDCRIFTLTEDEINKEYKYYYSEDGVLGRTFIGETLEFPKGWKMGIRSLTNNARENKDKNHPNIGADWEEVDI